MSENPKTDEDIRSDPGAATVDEVLAVFGRTAPEDIEAVKELEAEGQARKGILGYAPPAPEPEPVDPLFSRERLLGADGPLICGEPHHVIAGALHGDDGYAFTRQQVQDKVTAFYGREVEQED